MRVVKGNPTVSIISIQCGHNFSTTGMLRRQVFAAARNFSIASRRLAVKPFLLADVGEGIKECEMIQWFVQPGARVDEFDPICEVQSDKASVEITSRYSGVIKKLHYDIGQMAQVGRALLEIDTEEDEPSAPVKSSAEPQAQPPVEPATPEAPPQESSKETPTVRPHIKSLATPAVRRLCREHQLEVDSINGTGKDGRVMKEDVLKKIANPTSTQSTAVSNETIPLKGAAKQMFKSMSKAALIPHFLYTEEIEMDNLMALRGRVNKALSTKNMKLSFMPFMIKALSVAILKYPAVNSRLLVEQEALETRAAHNIAVAMDTPAGLVVPVIKNVQDLSVIEIGQELVRLQNAGAAGKLQPSDLQGGTITLSNIGTVGGMFVAPVIVDSQVCIGGIGSIRKLPRYDEHNNIVPRNILCTSWSGDHRALDGMTLASMVACWKGLLEHPDQMLLDLR